ncbi:hypothetical protein HWV62_22427 [Athelia sp. TMB]|nr:hypothetical protein HWV62_27773 [Athelia sp. TMB]KAF7983403.1 hypothetical protein HWV62_22427 [Athelia sp. TMB]
MSIIAIITTIISAAELAAKAGKCSPANQVAAELIPAPPTELKEKFRWLQCTIKNETQFDVLLQGTYFDSGRYWTAPGSFSSFAQMVFSCCNGDHTVMTGATGGTALRVSLDDKHFYDVALGWTAPTAGSFKAGVVESSSPKDGYESATAEGKAVISDTIFEGKDKDGNKARFRIHLSAAPGLEALFVIKQVLVAA